MLVTSSNPTIQNTHAGFPRSTSSATTKTSGMIIPAASRADVAYFRVEEVHTAHFGFGNVQPGVNYGGWKRKHLHPAGLASDNTEYFSDDGIDPWNFDDASAASSALEDCHLESFGLALRANSAVWIQEMLTSIP